MMPSPGRRRVILPGWLLREDAGKALAPRSACLGDSNAAQVEPHAPGSQTGEQEPVPFRTTVALASR